MEHGRVVGALSKPKEHDLEFHSDRIEPDCSLGMSSSETLNWSRTEAPQGEELKSYEDLFRLSSCVAQLVPSSRTVLILYGARVYRGSTW
ncbi:hypothetical protein Tco_1245803 [Tanacetum coccineum]